VGNRVFQQYRVSPSRLITKGKEIKIRKKKSSRKEQLAGIEGKFRGVLKHLLPVEVKSRAN